MTATEATDIVIIDETEKCPYLDGETAPMPLRMPLGKVSLEEADRRLADGHRRTGEFIYQTNCPNCMACEPIRLNCAEFNFSRNQRRVLRNGNAKFRQVIGELSADELRVSLFNKHRRQRGLAKRDSDIDIEEYIWGFVRSCFESFEITYWLDEHLVCCPRNGLAEPDKGYRQFLGLCSHEYFHLWNVKRIRPARLAEADLVAEVHTELLWAFEGITRTTTIWRWFAVVALPGRLPGPVCAEPCTGSLSGRRAT